MIALLFRQWTPGIFPYIFLGGFKLSTIRYALSAISHALSTIGYFERMVR
jgi:hypothetical protein